MVALWLNMIPSSYLTAARYLAARLASLKHAVAICHDRDKYQVGSAHGEDSRLVLEAARIHNHHVIFLGLGKDVVHDLVMVDAA
jgi:hypothetical protein